VSHQTGCSSAHLSKDEGSETGNSGEDGRAGEASGTSLSGGSLSGRLGNGLVTAVRGRGDDGRGDGLGLLGARDLDGLGLDGGDGGDVLLGDVGGGVAGALGLLRLLRGLRLLRLLGGLRLLRLAGVLGLAGVLRGGTVATVGRAGRVRVLGGRTDRADGGGDGDGLGHNDGRVSRAVGDVVSAVNDGVDMSSVDGRGGVRLGLNGSLSGGRAVGDVRGAAGDGAHAGRGDIVGLSGGLGVGHSGRGDNGDSRETHLDWFDSYSERELGVCVCGCGLKECG